MTKQGYPYPEEYNDFMTLYRKLQTQHDQLIRQIIDLNIEADKISKGLKVLDRIRKEKGYRDLQADIFNEE